METILAFAAAWLAGIPGWLMLAGAPDRAEPASTPRRPVLVLDLGKPALLVERGEGAAPVAVAVRGAPDASFARAAAEGSLWQLPPFSYLQAAAPSYRIRMTLPPPRPAAAMPAIYGDDPELPLVVIDPGHGGEDPGAISPETGAAEKDLALRTALAVRDRLLESGRVRVALTREEDRFLILQERYGIARRLRADLFLSIHCDSAADAAASGATAYTLSEVASDKEAARLAARENRADVIAGVDLGTADPDISSILIDLAQRETMAISADFAELLGREAASRVPVRARFHRMASLIVLKAPDLPSILFETGYLSNAGDARFLATAEGRARIAEAVASAVQIHFARRRTERDRAAGASG